MQKQIQRAFISMKERTHVSCAKIATIGGFCSVNLIIVKSTSPNDLPLPNKYVDELLKIFSISPSSHRTFALGFTRRFGETKSWRVALKCLLLLHRLLQSLPYDSLFRAELLWTRTNSLLSLYPCNFCDSSSSDSQDYTTFIRSYARLLNEALDSTSMEITYQHQETVYKIKESERMIEILPQLQSLLDRVTDCWPTGATSRSFLVHSAMKHIIRDSFVCYTTLKREIVMVLDNLIQLPYRSSIAAFGIYKKAAFQADKLSQFHECCKSMGYCGPYEYPLIDRIPDIQIQALESFLDGMCDQSSSSNMSTQTSSLSLTDEDGDKRARRNREFDEAMKKDTDIIMKPLTQWEAESNSVGWEDLLEASISANYTYRKVSRNDFLDGGNGWQLQAYNPYDFQSSNSFHQQTHRTNCYHGHSCPNTPVHTWKL